MSALCPLASITMLPSHPPTPSSPNLATMSLTTSTKLPQCINKQQATLDQHMLDTRSWGNCRKWEGRWGGKKGSSRRKQHQGTTTTAPTDNTTLEQVSSEAGIWSTTQGGSKKDVDNLEILWKNEAHRLHSTLKQVLHNTCKDIMKAQQHPHTAPHRAHTSSPLPALHQKSWLPYLPMLPLSKWDSCPLPPPLPCTPKHPWHAKKIYQEWFTTHRKTAIQQKTIPCTFCLHCKLWMTQIHLWWPLYPCQHTINTVIIWHATYPLSPALIPT